MAQWAHRAATEGPPRVSSVATRERKADSGPSLPCFRRRFGWKGSNEDFISPMATGTEFTALLPKPPARFLNDPAIRAALGRYRDDTRIETSFHVDRLCSLLADHPSQSFIEPVLWGLENGFRPFDKGNWDPNADTFKGNYTIQPRLEDNMR